MWRASADQPQISDSFKQRGDAAVLGTQIGNTSSIKPDSTTPTERSITKLKSTQESSKLQESVPRKRRKISRGHFEQGLEKSDSLQRLPSSSSEDKKANSETNDVEISGNKDRSLSYVSEQKDKNQDLGLTETDRSTQSPSSGSPKDENIDYETNAAEIAVDQEAKPLNEHGLLHRQQPENIDTESNGENDQIPLSQEGYETTENENLPDQPADLQDTETLNDSPILDNVQFQNENQSTSPENSEKSREQDLQIHNIVPPAQNQVNVENSEIESSMKIFKCGACEKSFLSETNFMNHIRMHERKKDSSVRPLTGREREFNKSQGIEHSEKKHNPHQFLGAKSLFTVGTQASNTKDEKIILIANDDVDHVAGRHDENKSRTSDNEIPEGNEILNHRNQEHDPDETEVGIRKYDDNTHPLGTETQTELKQQSLSSTPQPNIDILEQNFTNFYKSVNPRGNRKSVDPKRNRKSVDPNRDSKLTPSKPDVHQSHDGGAEWQKGEQNQSQEINESESSSLHSGANHTPTNINHMSFHNKEVLLENSNRKSSKNLPQTRGQVEGDFDTEVPEDNLDVTPQTVKHNNTKSSSALHRRTHNGKSPDKTLKASSSLASHPNTHRKAFECDYCGKAFQHKCHLVRHLRCHTGEKNYECAHCSKTFKEKSHLVSHLKVHVETTVYQCNQCNKSFKYKYHFDRHVKLHSKERPYKCDQCETSYKEKKSLERHLKTHIGEKCNEEWMYQCHQCHKRLKTRTLLELHRRTHREHNLHQCIFCDKSFRTKASLTLHLHKHGELKSSKGKVPAQNLLTEDQSNTNTSQGSEISHGNTRPVTTIVNLPDESIEKEGSYIPQSKDQVDDDVNDLVENFQVHSPPASEMSFRTFGTLTGYLDESIDILQTRRQKSGYHPEMEKSRNSTHGSDLSQEEIISHEDYSTNSKVRNESINFPEELNEEEGPHTRQSKDQVDEDVNDLVENFQVHSPPASEMSFRTFGTLTGYLDESIDILQTRRQKSGYHPEMEKSRNSTHGSDLSQEEIISHEDYSTNSKVRNESINFPEELNEEEGPHTRQSKDQVDEDDNDLVENFQVHSPPASEMSFRTFGTLTGYLDESIGILQTMRQKSGYHWEMEKSRISTHGSDLSQEEIISHEDYSTNSKVRNESINFPEELNEEEGPHTRQSKDQVDDDVNDLVENFQVIRHQQVKCLSELSAP